MFIVHSVESMQPPAFGAARITDEGGDQSTSLPKSFKKKELLRALFLPQSLAKVELPKPAQTQLSPA